MHYTNPNHIWSNYSDHFHILWYQSCLLNIDLQGKKKIWWFRHLNRLKINSRLNIVLSDSLGKLVTGNIMWKCFTNLLIINWTLTFLGLFRTNGFQRISISVLSWTFHRIFLNHAFLVYFECFLYVYATFVFIRAHETAEASRFRC